ncbi:MAG: hypothetical protein M3P86_06015 [Actinomycetota bacterium]|nr:hypothetical protein [Actinomycetota bacterium]
MGLRTGTEEGRSVRAADRAEGGGAGRRSGVVFDWWVAALSGWLVGGFLLDVWAHHSLPATQETFFTPWHGVLYSGFLAVAAFLVGTFVREIARGRAPREAMPAGYGASLAGVGIFFAGGLGDVAWHLLFGIEVDVEALLSPSHLALVLGAGLIVSGPLRSAWGRGEAGLPAVLSLGYAMLAVAFVTEVGSPFATPWAAAGVQTVEPWAGVSSRTEPTATGQALGVVGILLQTAVLMGFVLPAVRRWASALPFGSLTLLFAFAATTALTHGQYRFVPVALAAGLLADLLLRALEPSAEQATAMRAFAFAVPVALYGLYFLALAFTGGVWWTAELWTGSILLAGGVGVLVSYLVLPSAAAPLRQEAR